MRFYSQAYIICNIDTIYKLQISLFLSIRTSIIFHIPFAGAHLDGYISLKSSFHEKYMNIFGYIFAQRHFYKHISN